MTFEGHSCLQSETSQYVSEMSPTLVISSSATHLYTEYCFIGLKVVSLKTMHHAIVAAGLQIQCKTNFSKKGCGF